MRYLKLHSEALAIFLFIFLLTGIGCLKSSTAETSTNKNALVLDLPNNQPTPPKKVDPSKTANPEPSETPFEDEDAPALTESDVVSEGRKIEDFAQKDWYLAAQAEGDLNGDNLPDAVAVFSKAKLFDGKTAETHSDEQSEEDVRTPRLLVIALRNADNLLKLRAMNQKAILCRTCGGQMDDSFLSVGIKNKIIILSQAALGPNMTTYTHKIKLSPEVEWIVFYGEVEYDGGAKGKSKFSKQTGIIPLNDFNITKEREKLWISN